MHKGIAYCRHVVVSEAGNKKQWHAKQQEPRPHLAVDAVRRVCVHSLRRQPSCESSHFGCQHDISMAPDCRIHDQPQVAPACKATGAAAVQTGWRTRIRYVGSMYLTSTSCMNTAKRVMMFAHCPLAATGAGHSQRQHACVGNTLAGQENMARMPAALLPLTSIDMQDMGQAGNMRMRALRSRPHIQVALEGLF